MVKIFFASLLLLYAASINASKLNKSIFYGVGERVSKVDWNIAGNLSGTNPNIISELTWKQVKSHQISIGVNLNEDDYFLQIFGEYGNIYDGKNQDSDYNSDDRMNEFSRSVNSSGKGYLLDAEILYGQDYFYLGKIKISPMIGYGFHRQHLKIYDGAMVIGSADLTGLDSLYEANWKGPIFGIGVNYKKNKSIFAFDYSFQDIDFNGYTDWNLRSDLKHPKSMTQKGSGSGTKISASYERALSDFSSLSLVGTYYKYSADGVHTFHLLSNDHKQKLNQVNWEGREIMLIYRSLF